MKTALVTGGAGGIGEAICRELAADGYMVYVNYSRSREKAEAIAAEINGKALGFDVSDANSVREAFSSVGRLDLLVNNAGISEIDLFTSIPYEKAVRILDVNLKGAMNCARAALPAMINAKSGSIINISSMWGQCGASCEVDYSASKAGLIGFTKALAKEVAPSGVRVNCVAPGFIMTEMNSRFSQEDLDLIHEDIPLGIFGEPRHIADAVAFLASPKAEYITGQILAVNGGMVI
ncbi:MAG: 3-oxoacyl-ACP reductase FabG [Ruminococcus sp.]|uniref:elongation factor P 5-aminopentanone reductase n=1 Tax=Ruminococcus sp. TaxID=41978 RepID=UPI0025FDEC5A|nr:3-oxoacyl-ACP reductase FabG [Ruminococcus sp.]MCR5601790.1 3-oxoacyl-ACP reductase FabG [Ruminococcus sp.]